MPHRRIWTGDGKQLMFSYDDRGSARDRRHRSRRQDARAGRRRWRQRRHAAVFGRLVLRIEQRATRFLTPRPAHRRLPRWPPALRRGHHDPGGTQRAHCSGSGPWARSRKSPSNPRPIIAACRAGSSSRRGFDAAKKYPLAARNSRRTRSRATGRALPRKYSCTRPPATSCCT